MAVGNAIVNTAKFKPLTIAEWSAPLKEYATQHTAMEDALTALASNADDYERYVRENPNSEVAKQYYQYVNAIEEQAANLARNGITPQSRADLLSLKRNYNSSVKPIKRAVETAEDLAKLRTKYASQGIVMQDYDVPYLLEHPEVNPGNVNMYMGKDVMKDFATAFKSFQNYDATPSRVLSEDGKYITTTIPTNYTTTEIQNALAEVFPEYGFTSTGEEAPKEVVDKVKAIKDKYKFDSNMDESMKQSFVNLALTGINSVDMRPRITDRNAVKDPAPKEPKVVKTEEEKQAEATKKTAEKLGENLTNMSLVTLGTTVNGNGKKVYSLNSTKKLTNPTVITIEEAQRIAPKQLSALRKLHKDFNNSYKYFEIQKGSEKIESWGEPVIGITLKEEYKSNKPVESKSESALDYQEGGNKNTKLDIG